MDTAMTKNDAFSITQDFLDRQGEMLDAGDLEASLQFWDLPCTFENMDGVTHVTTLADMQAICLCFVRQLRSRQLTHTVRTCREAVAKDETTIWAAYETRFIRDGKFLSDVQYSAFVILKLRDGHWKVSSMQVAVGKDNPLGASLAERAAALENA
jgi:hypothetical protein